MWTNLIKTVFSFTFVSFIATGCLYAQQSGCSDPLPDHDYSVVGYHHGTEPVPYHQRQATLRFDSGRFTIDHLIRLSDGDVLRGAGRDKTVLYFPKGLKDLGEPCGHKGVDCFDWGNGVIRASGKEIGIEDLTIEFPTHEWCHYCGDKNGGYNGMSLSGCTDCWVKNVTIRNCDSGLFIEMRSSNVTAEGVDVFTNPGIKSHLHIAISGFSSNNLVTGFKLYGTTFHGLTGNWGSFSNVFANGWGETLRIEPDHNCNGVGGAESCCPDMLYSNITGTVESVQARDRSRQPLTAILWNVGEKTRCPEDAYGAQVAKKAGTKK
jgi:hypothetical protein